jgi:hypothetical protein
MDSDLDMDEIWEDAELSDSEADGEVEWTDSDTTFSEALMSISAELAGDSRCSPLLYPFSVICSSMVCVNRCRHRC